MSIRMRTAGLLGALCLLSLSAGPASAVLLPGEYTCAGASGILIGLGFRLDANGGYTDLDGKSRGRVTYGTNGTTVTFVGGHLAGEIGRNLRNGGKNFEINMISCSRN